MRTMDQWLASEETGKAFSHCLCCRFPLLEIAEPCLVYKEMRRGECVMEYAICQPCRDVVSAKISEESKTAVRAFLEREIDWEERIEEFKFSNALTDRISACICCHERREELESFSISALLDSDGTLVLGPLPLLICQSCSERMVELLSVESRALWQRFLAEHFSGPPTDSGMSGLF